MKTIKRKLIWGFAGLALIAASCGEDFVTASPEGEFFEDNYYQNEEQAFSGLVAVYDVLRKNSSGFENMITMMNAGSDDFFAGGGGPSDGAGIHGFDDFTIDPVNMPSSFYKDWYRGIARANVLLLKMPQANMSDAARARFTAEARVLRSFYYFQLINMFGDVPFITEPVLTADLFNIDKSPKAEIYAFIEAEMLASIADLPVMLPAPASPTVPSVEAGRLTQGSARAILGKIYLYQNKWSEAAAQFAEVNGTPGGTSQYGYKLVENFASLWSVSNKWNSESILEVSHTNLSNAGWGNWGSGSDEGNSVNQMVGPRGYNRPDNSTAPSFISGWSFNPVAPELYNAYAPNDPRRDISILNIAALGNQAGYAPGDQDTGFFLRKFMPLTSETSTGGGNTELNYRQNTYWIRLADTYLMEAEAILNGGGDISRAQALLDAVRIRVGLAPVEVSQAAIANERRLELAGEGFRFFDLVRTGRTDLLTPFGFQSGKNEVLPLPFNDIANTPIQQNNNY